MSDFEDDFDDDDDDDFSSDDSQEFNGKSVTQSKGKLGEAGSETKGRKSKSVEKEKKGEEGKRGKEGEAQGEADEEGGDEDKKTEYKFEINPTMSKAWLVKVPDLVAKKWHELIDKASGDSTTTTTTTNNNNNNNNTILNPSKNATGLPPTSDLIIGKLIQEADKVRKLRAGENFN